ncbi:MAG TPA: hypothetical protein VLU43_02110 [Anaeromyxobacteraceae bacterium]|nr:hypothetical protein [Anaeromyxobacteraceae bacterium]
MSLLRRKDRAADAPAMKAVKAPPLARVRGGIARVIRSAVRRPVDWARRHPVLGAATGLAVLAAIAAGVAIAVVPRAAMFPPPTLADLRERARAHPSDAAAQRALGHAQWDAGQRRAAIASYARALGLDAGGADRRTIDDLVSAFGTAEQAEAAALLVKFKLAGAAPGLERHARSTTYATRWAALWTLEKLGKATRASYVAAYTLDLSSAECDIRRRAVDRLGALADRRSLSALARARAEDQKTGGWFRSRCLGERLDQAEQKILARR